MNKIKVEDTGGESIYIKVGKDGVVLECNRKLWEIREFRETSELMLKPSQTFYIKAYEMVARRVAEIVGKLTNFYL